MRPAAVRRARLEMKLRVKFEKLGAIRFASHRDMLRVFQRCFSAAGIPVSYSRGFHPHVKMSFGPPLKTGWDSHEEYFDVCCEETVDDMARACNLFLPEGLRFTEVVELGPTAEKIANALSAVKMAVRVDREDVPELASFPAGSAGYEAVKKKYVDNINRRFAHGGGDDDTNGKTPEIIAVTITNGDEHICIEYTSTMLSGKIVTPDRVVAEVIGDISLLRIPLRVTRLAQYVGGGGEYHSPMSQGVVRNKP